MWLDDDGLVAVREAGAALVHLDARSGSPRWSLEAASGERFVHCSVGSDAVAATIQRSGDGSREGVLVELSTGSVRWRRAIGAQARLTIGALGDGVGIEHACALEPLDPTTGRPRAARIDGVTVDLSAVGDGGPPACASRPLLLLDVGSRAVVLHAPAHDRVELAAVDARHDVGQSLGSVALPRPVRTSSVRADPRSGTIAAQVSETEWLIFAIDAAAPSIRWSRRVGAERDCPPSALAAPVRFVRASGGAAVFAQVCTSATLLSASDGAELFVRAMGRDVAALSSERTRGLWDAAALPPMGARRVVWLAEDGSPQGSTALPEDGVAEGAAGELVVLSGGRVRVLGPDDALRWEASVDGARVLATMPSVGDRPALALLLTASGGEIVAIAMGVFSS